MTLEDIQNYAPAMKEYRELLQEEAQSYKIVAIIFVVLGIIACFFFVFLGIALFLVAAWSFISNVKSKSPGGKLFIGRVIEKSTASKKEYAEGQDEPTIFEQFFMKMELQRRLVFEGQPTGTLRNFKRVQELRVNRAIHFEFEEGAETGFIITPANDLIGYISQQEIKFLTVGKEIAGKTTRVIKSVDQDSTSDMRLFKS